MLDEGLYSADIRFPLLTFDMHYYCECIVSLLTPPTLTEWRNNQAGGTVSRHLFWTEM